MRIIGEEPMVAWPHVLLLSKHISEGLLMFGFEARILFRFSVSMDILVSSFPEVNHPMQGHLLN